LQPWKHGEEVVVIVEALNKGQGFFGVASFALDRAVDIQDLGILDLNPIPELVVSAGTVSWSAVTHDAVIGYSAYHGTNRMNNTVITEQLCAGTGETVLRLVFRGGYETVYGSQNRTGLQMASPAVMLISPNPFVMQTAINYTLAEQTMVEISVYDVQGALVRKLVSGNQKPGIYCVIWNGDDNRGRSVASGIYFIRKEAGQHRQQEKIILIR
jgi:hypothetical protein